MQSPADIPRSQPGAGAVRFATVCGVAAVAMLLLRQVVYQNTFDLDLFHQMSVWRAGLPREDVFAFTPTVTPSVHYEWGNGAIAYALISRFGLGGLLALKYALTLA